MAPIPLLVELCAGTAALSLRLHRDGARPPVSRMGSKAGYADAILRVLGLVPGQRADRYLWCEPDPGVRLLLEAYRDGALAKAAAAIIRSWAGEDPRALWERLRAEGPPRLPDGGAEAGEVARWAVIQSSNTMIVLDENWRNTGKGGSTFYRRDDPRRCAEPLAEVGALPATVRPDARDIDPPALPPGTVAYMDPPYVGTTGYADDLPRAEVVALARRWAAAGATVAISEAEAIPELVAEGWHAVRIDGERVGQKRTFSKQQEEWVTMNRPPAWVPPVQGALFGGT
jgi:hypothetical protein